ncbi:MFS transporter [Fodinicola acaciae]|uniref:MFS transporter n=1 Tax=Fodinicola acaciae TaxID=2681555 RepID=UPI0013D1B51E|nr:MFS transporter [Fodinicola acaciae]
MHPTDTGERLWTAPYAVLCVATLGYFTASGMMMPVLPRLVVGPLHGSAVDVGAAALTFGVATLAARIPMVRLAARWSERSVLTAGCLLLVAGSLLLLVPVLPAVFGSRLLIGAADAAFYTTSVDSAYRLAPRIRRASAVSYLSLTVYVGLLAGPVAGEAIRVRLGFDAVWTVAALVAAGSAVLVGRGPATPAAAVTGPVEKVAWRTGMSAQLALLAFLFVVCTYGTDGYLLFVPLYAESLGQPDATVYFVALIGSTLLLRPGAARWLDRSRPEPTSFLALAAITGGLLVVAVAVSPAGLLAGTILLGCGQALGFPALLHLAAGRTAAGQRTLVIAVATACNSATFGFAGLTLGPIVQVAGFGAAFLTCAGIGAAGLVALTLSSFRRVRT